MTKEQSSIASAYVISALVGGVYLISWLTHVWGGQPWPINSNMVNYAVVLVLFGIALLLFGNLFARTLPQERGFVQACDARLKERSAAAVMIVTALVTAAYLIYYACIGVNKEFAGPTCAESSLTAPQLIPVYYLLTVLFFVAAIYLLLTGRDCPQWMTWGGYGLSAVMYFLGVWIVNTFEGDPYHGEAYLESIYNVADGVPYEELTTGIYGHYGLFFLLPMKIFGAKAVVIQFLIALVGVVTDLAMLYCIHHLIKKELGTPVDGTGCAGHSVCIQTDELLAAAASPFGIPDAVGSLYAVLFAEKAVEKNGSVLGRLASVHAGSAVEHRERSVLYHRLVRGLHRPLVATGAMVRPRPVGTLWCAAAGRCVGSAGGHWPDKFV